MRTCFLGLLLAGNVLVSTSAFAEVTVTMTNGNVSVSAKNATLSQILAEWARVGQTRIVNIERVSSAPVTIELVDVPESQALDTVLRSMSGYLAAPRTVPVANASTFDRIFLLPTSSGAPARSAPGSPAAMASPAPFAPPQVPPSFQPGPFNPDDDAPREPEVVRQAPLGRGAPNQPPMRGAVDGFPQPANGRPGALQPPAIQPPVQSGNGTDVPYPTPFGVVTPTNPFSTGGVATPPVGVATPGMPVPAPQQQQPDRSVR